MKTAEITKIKKALCINPDGIFGEKSVKALRADQVATGKTPDGILTEALKKELMALTDTEIETRYKKTNPMTMTE